MTSKRELEAELMQGRLIADALEKDCQEAHAKNRRLSTALEQVAKHCGFHEAYQCGVSVSVRDGGGVWRELPGAFDADALIADLDAIDQARSADEARARLGIKEEA